MTQTVKQVIICFFFQNYSPNFFNLRNLSSPESFVKLQKFCRPIKIKRERKWVTSMSHRKQFWVSARSQRKRFFSVKLIWNPPFCTGWNKEKNKKRISQEAIATAGGSGLPVMGQEKDPLKKQ